MRGLHVGTQKGVVGLSLSKVSFIPNLIAVDDLFILYAFVR
jgi:hypothetical protein